MPNKLLLFTRLEKEILDRYLDVVLKGNKDGLKVIYWHVILLIFYPCIVVVIGLQLLVFSFEIYDKSFLSKNLHFFYK